VILEIDFQEFTLIHVHAYIVVGITLLNAHIYIQHTITTSRRLVNSIFNRLFFSPAVTTFVNIVHLYDGYGIGGFV